MKLYITLLLSLFITAQGFSQQLSGKVIDAETNAPLIGATIKNKSGIATTDNSGNFKIDCQLNGPLTVSYIGYATSSQIIADCTQELVVKLAMAENKLGEVEITASSSKEKLLLTEPRSIVQLDTTELQRGNGLFLSEAINTNVPGVQMQQRTIAGGQSFNIRGYGNGLGFRGASNNFDGQGSKVYLNGIPLTDAEGITVLDDIDFGSIDKVEVTKGPSGTLYGLAIAGVVNLQTKKAAKNTTSIGQNTMLGSYGLFRSTTQVAIGGENSSVLINYGIQEFDGFMDHTQSHKDFVNVMGDFKLNEKQSITAYLGYSDSYDERNGELTITQYEEKDYSGNSRYIQNDAHSAVKSFRAGIGQTYKFNEHFSNTTTFFGSTLKMDNSSAGGWNDKAPLNYGLRSTLDVNYKLSDNISINGITGIELQTSTAVANSYGMVADSTNLEGYNVVGGIRSIQSATNSTAAYFTQWTLLLPKSFSVTAGLGISTMKVELQDRLWGTKSNTPGSAVPQIIRNRYDDLISPTVSINKKINDKASVYVTYSVGYKAPVGSQFYIPYTNEVNKGLVPEKGTQIEVGTKGSLLNNHLYYEVAVFNARFEDKMSTVAVSDPEQTTTLYSYITNSGSLNNNGFEALIKYEAIKEGGGFFTSIAPFANLTYSDFKYDNFSYQKIGSSNAGLDSAITENYDGNQVAGVSPLVYNFGMDVNTQIGLYGNVTYNFRDAMYFTSDEANETESYTLVNAKLGFKKSYGSFGFDVYAGANNITSEQYYQMVFVNQLNDAYIPAPNEINYFGGVNLNYKF
ncbi:TonB-dependent receptor [Acidiluteibacter ferrifornacis]|uniref:TonB-dependent receptor plug domain-containing protein n=1 Tax=Acidiluteibacter ferrifornacis TaxID=2692424 RepID=A0A6N9NKN2_9FLAO|nr:TonB-dependent receptor [Acidiluteibacter ferrifornacis]NBG65760.1 TonB-dependent receptor plug domain-containing protein [Acidiluteibacter ferrifornacis]